MPNHMSRFLGMIAESKLHAPNLKNMTLSVFRSHKSNRVARDVMINHLLALRYMNPAADITLVQKREAGVARVDYELLTGEEKGFEIKPAFSAELVVAKIMMAARDPDDVAASAPSSGAGVGGDLVDDAQREAR